VWFQEIYGSESVSENVNCFCDGYWERFERNELPPYEISGKYLFFSTEREALVKIAVGALECGGFHHAKIQMEGKTHSPDYVLCLYYKDDSRKHELARRYCNQQNVRYRYWKSDEDTHRGKYSEQFLKGLSPIARKLFQQDDTEGDENEKKVEASLEPNTSSNNPL